MTPALPSALPASSTELDRQWRKGCTTPALRWAHLLDVLGADRLRRLVATDLSSVVLGGALLALDECFEPTRAREVADVLAALAAGGRFGLMCALLEDKEAAAAGRVLDRLAAAAAAAAAAASEAPWPSDLLPSIQAAFGHQRST